MPLALKVEEGLQQGTEWLWKLHRQDTDLPGGPQERALLTPHVRLLLQRYQQVKLCVQATGGGPLPQQPQDHGTRCPHV